MSKRKIGGGQLKRRREQMRKLVGLEVDVEFTINNCLIPKAGLLVRYFEGDRPGYYVKAKKEKFQLPLNYIASINGTAIEVNKDKTYSR